MFLKAGLCISYGGPWCRKGKDYVVGTGDYNRFGQEEVDAGQFTCCEQAFICDRFSRNSVVADGV